MKKLERTKLSDKTSIEMAVSTLHDTLILNDLTVVGSDEWWNPIIGGEPHVAAYWTIYYNALEEEAIRRGLI